jgi:hypothetical protein
MKLLIRGKAVPGRGAEFQPLRSHEVLLQNQRLCQKAALHSTPKTKHPYLVVQNVKGENLERLRTFNKKRYEQKAAKIYHAAKRTSKLLRCLATADDHFHISYHYCKVINQSVIKNGQD